MAERPHDEHRKRLRARVLSAGESFEDHELLELLLFYAIPRVNTNEIAHELIKRFGSLKGVLDASYLSLRTVEGIGDNSALYLRAISELLLRYERSSNYTDNPLSSNYALGRYLCSLFVGTENEISYLLLFDNSKRLILCAKISEGYSSVNTVYLRKIITLALENNAAGVILAHNHPSGKALPSGEDIEVTSCLKGMYEKLGIQFIDHFIIANDECRPIINYKKTMLFNSNPLFDDEAEEAKKNKEAEKETV